MYNARKNPKSAKNSRGNDTCNSKYMLNCSCPTKFQFKNDQSRCDDKTYKNNNFWVKTAEESEKFLQSELEKYGLTPRTKKATDTNHYNSSVHSGRVDINFRSVPDNRVIKVNIKEIPCRNKYKSKTEPNLTTDRYVEDLKKEIKSKKKDIPSLPDRYKKKYVRSLKDELLLNKLATRHDSRKHVEGIKREIETYRAHHSPFDRADGPSNLNSNYQPTKFKISVNHKNKKREAQSEDGSTRGHKVRERRGMNSEAGDGHDR
ncbi:uncharacterized protein LOC123309678 [Coccinella septempunctata]|uniref:uncharacterized protein LOC123309678 n=1 Tax=Coccinella septempunctata TaxID=41139 RepID=UPI001D08E2BA|nr:uncharacterized protein LOC123309678 [Coccinella septempunctata]